MPSSQALASVMPSPAARGASAPVVEDASLVPLLARVSIGLLLITVLLCLALREGAALLREQRFTADPGLRMLTIGSDVLEVPASMIRSGAQRRATSLTRLDLLLHASDMAGYRPDLDAAFTAVPPDPELVFVTIEPRTMRLDMTARADAIYAPHLDGSTPAKHVAGLRLDRLRGSGLDGEWLARDTGTPPTFVARCTLAGGEGPAAYCLRDIHVGRGLSLTYCFHEALLPRWRTLETALMKAMEPLILTAR